MSGPTKRPRRKPGPKPGSRRKRIEAPKISKADEPIDLKNLGNTEDVPKKVDEPKAPTYIVDIEELLHQLAILKTGYMQHAPGVFANQVARLCIKHGDGSDISPEEASRLINAKFQN